MQAKLIMDRLQDCIKDLVKKFESGTDTSLMYLPSECFNGYITVVNKITPRNNNNLIYDVIGNIVKQIGFDNQEQGLLNIVGLNHKLELDDAIVEVDIGKEVIPGEPINNDIGYTLNLNFYATVELIDTKEPLIAEEFEVSYKEQIEEVKGV